MQNKVVRLSPVVDVRALGRTVFQGTLCHGEHATVVVSVIHALLNSHIPVFLKSITKDGCSLHCEYIAFCWRKETFVIKIDQVLLQ